MAALKLKVKLLVDKEAQKVIFAEASKTVVDFLFSLLSLPVGTVVKLLTKNSMVGSLGNLYSSVENISEGYMKSNHTKVSLLEPKLPICVAQVPLLMSNPTSPTPDQVAVQYYTCCYFSGSVFGGGNNVLHFYVSNNSGTPCPQCQRQMSTPMNYVVGTGTEEEKPIGDKGFVKGLVTYMVMDDLSLTPMSTISGITFLNKFNIRQVGCLEEQEVDLGMDEGLAILKASLQSKTVLTDVFLGKKFKRPSCDISSQ